jgi:hypothetical protein
MKHLMRKGGKSIEEFYFKAFLNQNRSKPIVLQLALTNCGVIQHVVLKNIKADYE